MKQPINNGHMSWVSIDFDDTLCRNTGLPDFLPTEIIEGANKACKEIRAKGFVPIIYTARGWEDHEIVKHWVKDNNLDIEFIVCGKLLVRWHIDDRNIEFKGDWKEVLDKIK
jgi:hypothetical protein